MSSSSLLNFLVVILILFSLIGYSAAATPKTLDQCKIDVGCVRAKNSKGEEYGYLKSDELITSTVNGKHGLKNIYGINTTDELVVFENFVPAEKNRMYYCKHQDDGTCDNKRRKSFHFVDFGQEKFILKYEAAVMEPRFLKNPVFPVDVATFHMPAFSLYRYNEHELEVLISAGHINAYYADNEKRGGPYVRLVDLNDICKAYRPLSVTVFNHLNHALFINHEHFQFSWYFIKKDNFICSYAFKHEDLFEYQTGGFVKAKEKKADHHYLVNSYPTKNYSPYFFCVDALYGTFVSLYWLGKGTSAEAHFYSINEDNLDGHKLVHTIVLKNFDEYVLKMIFNGEFDPNYPPVFQSYGAQVYVWFKYPKTQKSWEGLWKNGTDGFYDVKEHVMEVTGQKTTWNTPDYNIRYLFRAKKSWINKYRPDDAPTPTPTTATTTTSLPPVVSDTTLPPPEVTLPPEVPETTLPPKTTTTTRAATTTTTSTTTAKTETPSTAAPQPQPVPEALTDSAAGPSVKMVSWLFILILFIGVYI